MALVPDLPLMNRMKSGLQTRYWIFLLMKPLKSNIHLYLEQGACILAAFPGKEEGYDSAEPNEHNKYQDFRHSHWKNSLIWESGWRT